MCFSATASFIAGASLPAIGAMTVKKAERKAELPFAAIPLLFGVQQILEGIIWLTFRFDTPLLNTFMTNAYSLFSHVLWPFYVPFAVLALEPVPWRRKVLYAFLYETWLKLLPGFAWLTWPSFLLGLVETFLYGVYFGLVFAPLYNFFRSKRP